MSRWKWHEKPGVRKGRIMRHSSRLTSEQEERLDHDRHEAEYMKLIHHEPIKDTCIRCEGRGGYISDLSDEGAWILCEVCHGSGRYLSPSNLSRLSIENLIQCEICGAEYLKKYESSHKEWHLARS